MSNEGGGTMSTINKSICGHYNYIWDKKCTICDLQLINKTKEMLKQGNSYILTKHKLIDEFKIIRITEKFVLMENSRGIRQWRYKTEFVDTENAIDDVYQILEDLGAYELKTQSPPNVMFTNHAERSSSYHSGAKSNLLDILSNSGIGDELYIKGTLLDNPGGIHIEDTPQEKQWRKELFPETFDPDYKKPIERWKPGFGDEYYFLNDLDEIKITSAMDYLSDIRFNAFNCFKTQQEAEKERDIRQIWFELRQFAKEWNANFKAVEGKTYSSDKWNLFYNDLGTKAAYEKFDDRLKLLDFDNRQIAPGLNERS